jgi:hypothetical protein
MVTPLVSFDFPQTSSRKAQPGDDVEVTLHNGQTSMAHLIRFAGSDTAIVRLFGLSIPRPYSAGDTLGIDLDKVASL